MKYTLLAIVGFVIFCIIKAAKRASGGTRHLRYCRERFNELCGQGCSEREALITISKERHPELDDQIHQKIVNKWPDVHRLAIFIHSALDFRLPWQQGYGGKLSNEKAEALIEHTTITESGRVNTNWGAVKEKLQRT